MPPSKPDKLLLLSSSPHAGSALSVKMIMMAVILAIIPTAVYGVVLFGMNALFLMLTAVVAAVAGELLLQLVTRQRPRITDLSSVITGLMLALIVPPSLPLWMMALGALFAVVVGKEFFGGVGQNPFNPALIGRAFLMMSFGTAMTTWHQPYQALDAVSAATPLGLLKGAEGGGMKTVIDSLAASGQDPYLTLFLGNRAGSIGETSVLLILIGGAFLLLLRVIEWRIPFALLGTTALLSWVLGTDPLFALLSGGLVFAAFFMATDYASGPITPKGRLLYGALIGVVTVVIRKWGGMPEGVTYAILIMNAVVPFLDKLREKKYGWIDPRRTAAGKAKEAGR